MKNGPGGVVFERRNGHKKPLKHRIPGGSGYVVGQTVKADGREAATDVGANEVRIDQSPRCHRYAVRNDAAHVDVRHHGHLTHVGLV